MLTKGFIEQQIEILQDVIDYHTGKERLEHELTDPYRNEAANDLNKRLMDLLADGKINEAESLLFEAVENDKNVDHDYLRVALDFYMNLDEYSDEYLELCDFSRGETDDGWAEITRLF